MQTDKSTSEKKMITRRLMHLILVIFQLLTISCSEASDYKNIEGCYYGDGFLKSKLKDGLRAQYHSFDIESLVFIKVDEENSKNKILIKAFVDGLLDPNESKKFGFGHWLAYFENGNLLDIYSFSGNASSYFDFELVDTHTELRLFEKGYWSKVNLCGKNN